MSTKSRGRTLVIFVIGLVFGAGAGVVILKRGIPLVGATGQWGVGIYVGTAPDKPFTSGNIKNPVLTIKDVTDMDADFVADPFMVKEGGTWYLFVEVLNNADGKGDLSVATSKDGIKFKYQKKVLDEKFHLSYPHVMKWKGQWWMVPESYEDKSIRLYKATKFPYKWKLEKKLVTGSPFVDSTLIEHDGKWWMWSSITGNNVLVLYYADALDGPWHKHPQNPLRLGDPEYARPGGPIIKYNGRLIRYAQDCFPRYGTAIRAFEVTKLTTTEYAEKVLNDGKPLIGATGTGWNALGMHQLDPHQIAPGKWIAAVDGIYNARRYGFAY